MFVARHEAIKARVCSSAAGMARYTHTERAEATAGRASARSQADAERIEISSNDSDRVSEFNTALAAALDMAATKAYWVVWWIFLAKGEDSGKTASVERSADRNLPRCGELLYY